MRFGDRLCRWALHAYPRDFQHESGEEVLGTIADMQDAGAKRGVLRQAASLGYNGNRLRWLRATDGSMRQTLRQGAAWGALLLIARQAGLGIYELVRPLWLPWARPSLLPQYPQTALSVVEVALFVGWLAVFGLLASGRRRWGLPLLGLVLAGFVAREVAFSLSYGGHFSWAFTLNFFLPILLPVLCAFGWPARRIRFSLPVIAAVLIGAVVIAAARVVFWGVGFDPLGQGYVWWWIQVALCLVAVVFGILAGLSDPRWAIAGVVVALQPVVREIIAESAGSRLSGAILLMALVPIVAVLLAFRASRLAVPRRG
jgi:hypothetical protein